MTDCTISDRTLDDSTPPSCEWCPLSCVAELDVTSVYPNQGKSQCLPEDDLTLWPPWERVQCVSPGGTRSSLSPVLCHETRPSKNAVNLVASCDARALTSSPSCDRSVKSPEYNHSLGAPEHVLEPSVKDLSLKSRRGGPSLKSPRDARFLKSPGNSRSLKSHGDDHFLKSPSNTGIQEPNRNVRSRDHDNFQPFDDIDQSKPGVCKKFLLDRCKYDGDSCWEIHPDVICKNYQLGSCRLGDICREKHEDPTPIHENFELLRIRENDLTEKEDTQPFYDKFLGGV